MSAGQQMPPWLQEQIGKMQQSQQNLQSILMQKQQDKTIIRWDPRDPRIKDPVKKMCSY